MRLSCQGRCGLVLARLPAFAHVAVVVASVSVAAEAPFSVAALVPLCVAADGPLPIASGTPFPVTAAKQPPRPGDRLRERLVGDFGINPRARRAGQHRREPRGDFPSVPSACTASGDPDPPSRPPPRRSALVPPGGRSPLFGACGRRSVPRASGARPAPIFRGPRCAPVSEGPASTPLRPCARARDPGLQKRPCASRGRCPRPNR